MPDHEPFPSVDDGALTDGVRLGFRDGSEMELSAEDPRAKVLRAVADALMFGRHS